MEMIGRTLHDMLLPVLGLLLAFLCFRYTGQWTFFNRLIIAYSRFNALVLAGVLCVVVGSSLIASIHFTTVRFVLTFAQDGPVASLLGGAPARSAALTLPVVDRVERINQLDPAQYASMQEYTTWNKSACSAASMAVAMNAYGYTYRVADVLAVESRLGAITPRLGLVSEEGIAQTVQQFGFEAQLSHSRSLSQVIALAHTGVPVIVSFPPSRWQGGHLLVVADGNDSTVTVIDSSSYNMHVLSHASFLAWWGGFSAAISPVSVPLGSVPARPATALFSAGQTSVLGAPSLTAAFIDQVLAVHHSPAAGTGWALFLLSQRYGIDDAFALAFFWHESNFGVNGEAAQSRSLGNVRCIAGYRCQDNYAWFDTWEQGYAAWYALIAGPLYVRAGHTTVETIIPVYAPAADHNNEQAYIANVVSVVMQLRAGHADF